MNNDSILQARLFFEGFDRTTASELGLGLLLLLLALYFTHLLTNRIGLRALVGFAERSSVKWDDILVEQRVFHRLVPLAPLIVLQLGIPWVPHLPEGVVELIQTLALCFLVLIGSRGFSALLSSANEIYRRYSPSADRPIKGYIQVVQVLTYIIAGLLIVSFLVGRSPLILLSGLGAMTAVLLLIFRDSLLSLVAGIQLTQNDLIRVNDWIEMPQFGADGDVIEVALNVVTVQNWDRTLTVIPTHKFLEHSFKNWRGMTNSGGRRIKRSIFLDMNSIRFLTPAEIDQLRSVRVLQNYLDEKLREITDHNETKVPREFAREEVNFRQLTNIGTFRAYITAYLREHPQIHQEMIFLIRQLQPTPQGLPLEIYVFSKDIRWVHYEGIQADIFDHLLAVIPKFGLRIFQEPTGSDFAQLRNLPSSLPSLSVPPSPESRLLPDAETESTESV